MRNVPRLSCFVLLGLFLASGSARIGRASDGRVTIKILKTGSIQVQVKGIPSNAWSFRNAIAGAIGLGDRIGNFRSNSGGIKQIAAGEFRSSDSLSNYEYFVDLRQPDPANVAHVSWLTSNDGVLMFSDLLPQNLIGLPTGLTVNFILPDGWSEASSEKREADGYHVQTPDSAVFLVSNSIERRSKQVAGTRVNLAISGSWPFGEEKALSQASKIVDKYSQVTKHHLQNEPTIMIAPLPVQSSLTKWRAETRGSSIVLLVDPSAKFPNWIGQLGVILTHEAFHLWVPNSLRLSGEYDWFFEGFTMYQALLTALDLRLIDFNEYLATLARVYDSYLSYPENQSLIGASERRWTSGASYVYDKGMLVAFMYDMMLRGKNGKTISSLYPDLFDRDKPEEGNEVIMKLLSWSAETQEFCRQYIEGKVPLNIESFVSAYGLNVDISGNHTQISIKDNLNDDQRKLLRSLGFRK